MTVFRVRPGNGLLKPSGTGWKTCPFPRMFPVLRSAGGQRRRRSSNRRKRLPRGGGTKPSCLCKIPLPFAGRQPSGKDSLCARIVLHIFPDFIDWGGEEGCRRRPGFGNDRLHCNDRGSEENRFEKHRRMGNGRLQGEAASVGRLSARGKECRPAL